MNKQQPKRAFQILLVGLFALGLLMAALPPGRDGQAANAQPVWGSKPVLSYMALTRSIAAAMRQGAGLSAAQFEAVRTIAGEEEQRIRALEEASLAIIQDEALSLEEKRAQIAASGHNRKVMEAVAATDRALQAALGADAYARLVTWIEARWIVERERHAEPKIVNGARTYSIWATRYDSGGAYTVALPDKCVKFANLGWHTCDDYGYQVGQHYSVKLTYQDSVTVEVLESGPWNVDDTYWATTSDPTPRRMFTDLPLGMPEAQAAYEYGYNGGEDQFGRTVTAPFGIDLARDVSIDIGLQPGENDWVEVTFLWTADWDTVPSEAVVLDDPTSLHPEYSGDMCGSYWHKISGYNGASAYLTLNVSDSADSTNWAEWIPDLPYDGEYRVEAFIPAHNAVDWDCPDLYIASDSSDARYEITYDGGQKTVSRDQAPLNDQWLNLGTYNFAAGSNGRVNLRDLNGEASLTRTVSFSAMRFSLLSPPPTPVPSATPRPTATPTPTPTPLPQVAGGVILAEPGAVITMPLQASRLQPPGLGAAALDLTYDPALLQPSACQFDPLDVFDSGACAWSQVLSNTLRVQITSTLGVSGAPLLANLGFQTLGDAGQATLLYLSAEKFAAPDGAPLPHTLRHGFVCIQPCPGVV
ncbi:MAG: hypothetical protein L0Z70_14715, partial [Chloroflexi bacterium]|nr:hypothetical protein [Chloroflexota bacterium]